MIAEVLGWIAFLLNVWGNLAIAKQSARGFIVRLACNAVFIIYSAMIRSWPLLLNHIVFAGINIYSYREWIRKESGNV